MATRNVQNNVYARMNKAIKGVPVPNTFALYDDNGQLGSSPAKNGTVYYVAPATGDDDSDLHDGLSWDRAFASMTPLDDILENGDTICLEGVLLQQWTAPIDVFDVTVIGMANRPRQATDGGVATGGGATWLKPAVETAATPLLRLREQGWKIVNIHFAHSADDAACIKLHRTEASAAMDASHAEIINCQFSDGLIGVEDVGGHSNVLIDGCTFYDLTTAIKITSQGIAIPNKWVVTNNRFLETNVNGLVGAWIDSIFAYNFFNKCTTITIHLGTGNTGLRNRVFFNHFNIAAADFDPAGGVTGNATDAWHNILTDAVETGLPAN